MYVQIMEQQINSVEQKQQNCQMRFLRKCSSHRMLTEPPTMSFYTMKHCPRIWSSKVNAMNTAPHFMNLSSCSARILAEDLAS